MNQSQETSCFAALHSHELEITHAPWVSLWCLDQQQQHPLREVVLEVQILDPHAASLNSDWEEPVAEWTPPPMMWRWEGEMLSSRGTIPIPLAQVPIISTRKKRAGVTPGSWCLPHPQFSAFCFSPISFLTQSSPTVDITSSNDIYIFLRLTLGDDGCGVRKEGR